MATDSPIDTIQQAPRGWPKMRALALWGLFLTVLALFWLDLVPRLHHEAEAKCLTANGPTAKRFCSLLISTGWHKSPRGLLRQARGRIAFSEGDYRLAVRDFKAAQKLELHLDQTEFWLGRALYERKRYDESVDAFSRALDAGDGQRSLIWRGWAAMKTDHAQAVADFDSVEAGPGYDAFKRWVHRGRGEMLTHLARYDEAISDLMIARELEPKNAWVTGMLSWASREKGDHRAALYWADATLGLSPTYRWGHQLRGQVLFQLGRYKEALEEFDWLLEQNFRRGHHMMQKAEALIRLGDHELEVETLIARREAGWSDLQLSVGLIRAHCALGETEKAVEQAKDALRHFADLAWFSPDIAGDPSQVCGLRAE